MARLSLISAAVLLWGSAMAATTATSTADAALQSPSSPAAQGQLTPQGCFSSLSNTATETKKLTFLSSGNCWQACSDDKYTVMILHGSQCFCATTYPAKDSLVSDSECNESCAGYDKEACGGSDAYSVFNTGEKVKVSYDEASTATGTATTSATGTASSSGSSKTASSSDSSASSASTPGAATGTSTTTESAATASQSSDAGHMFTLTHALAWVGLALAI